MKLIDKDALTEKLWERRVKNHDFGGSPYSEYGHEDDEILSLINSFEVKEFDLEKEMENWIENNQDFAGFYNNVEFAKHFFELGVSVSNKAEKEPYFMGKMGSYTTTTK